jgi:hypothetical protein
MSIQQYFQLFHGGLFYRWREKNYSGKTNCMQHVTDKLYHIKWYEHQSPQQESNLVKNKGIKL